MIPPVTGHHHCYINLTRRFSYRTLFLSQSARKKAKKSKPQRKFTVSGASEIWDVTSSFGARLSRAQFGIATIAGTASGGNPALYKHLGMGFPSNTLPPSHPQHPKTPLPFPATTYVGWGAPKDIPLTVVLLCDSIFIATVPGEPTVATGAQIEKVRVCEEGSCT